MFWPLILGLFALAVAVASVALDAHGPPGRRRPRSAELASARRVEEHGESSKARPAERLASRVTASHGPRGVQRTTLGGHR